MPGLDGLRAVAVAAVFAYHAQVAWLPGGFLGVDVFFVISGYLITALLLAEWQRTGAISLPAFWRRRARRLAPALLTVIAVTLLAGALLAAGQLPALRVNALAALAYVANWHDALAHVSYFSQFGRPPLLRHLWSLSVEEQFYALWPPLVILALVARRPGRVGWWAGVIALASGVEMALLAGSHSATRLYEGTDTRAATLLIGALAAVLVPPGRLADARRRVAPFLIDLLGLGGLAGLGVMMVGVHGETTGLFRGPLQVAGVFAVGAVLAAGAPGGAIGWALSRAPLTWIGRRSYGIYLWHWPVIVLTRSPGAGFGQSLALTAVQAGITLVLAAASYAWVEQPVSRLGWRGALAATRSRLARARLDRPERVAGLVGTGLAAVAIIAGAVTLFSGPFGGPAAAPAPRLLAAGPGFRFGSAPARRHDPVATRSPRDASPRRAGGPSTTGATIVFGDSVVLGTEPALARLLGPRTRFDAVVGRQPQDTIAAVAATRVARGLPRRVIVSLGDNGVVTGAMLHRLRRVLSGVAQVVLVTPRVPDPWGPPSAAVIRGAARWWPGVRIADWDRLSGDRDGWFSDGVHPDAAGVHAFIRLIAGAVR